MAFVELKIPPDAFAGRPLIRSYVNFKNCWKTVQVKQNLNIYNWTRNREQRGERRRKQLFSVLSDNKMRRENEFVC